MLKIINRNRSRLYDGIIKIFRRSNADDSGKPLSNTGCNPGKSISNNGGNSGKSGSSRSCSPGKPSSNSCGDSGKPQSNVSCSEKSGACGPDNQERSAPCCPNTSRKSWACGPDNQERSAPCCPNTSGKSGASGAGSHEKSAPCCPDTSRKSWACIPDNQERSAPCCPNTSGKSGASGGGGSRKSGNGPTEPGSQFPTKKMNEIYSEKVGNGHIAFPITMIRGDGVYLYDCLGNKYLDFTSSGCTVMLGHCHKTVAETISSHTKLLTQTPQYCQSFGLGLFSAYLTDLFGFEKVIVMNSGTEAVETAIKIARKFGYKHKNIPKNQAKIIVPEHGRWGKSLAALTILDNLDVKNKFGPHIPGFETVPFNDIKALEEKIKDPYVCGYLTEPIQVHPKLIIPDKCYFPEARRLCTEHGVLLMSDEVQVGLGRCGALTCSSLFSMTPDILILGKALSSGFLPVSATLADSAIMEEIDSQAFGSTYGGFPLGCFASIAALESLLYEKLIDNSKCMGEVLRQALECALPKDCIKDIRGVGLLNGIELHDIFRGYVSLHIFYELLCNGLMVKPPYDGVLFLNPPLCIKEHQIMHAVKIIRQTLLKLRGYCEKSQSNPDNACAKAVRPQKQKSECNENINYSVAGEDSNKLTKKSQMTQTSYVTHDKAVQCEDAELSPRLKLRKPLKTSKKKGSDEYCPSWCVESSMEEEESIPVIKSRKKNKMYDEQVMMENSEACVDPMFFNLSSISKISHPHSRNDNMKEIECKKSNSEDCVEPNQSPCGDFRMKQMENKSKDPEECVQHITDRHSEDVDCKNFSENRNVNDENSCPEEQSSEEEELPGRSTQPACKSFPFILAHPDGTPLLREEFTGDVCEKKSDKFKRKETDKKELPKIDYSCDEIQVCKDDQASCKKLSDELKKEECEKPSTIRHDQPKPYECENVCSKKIDRGKNPVTSKGIQPIPKKTSAGKKFYPQDGEIPSTSKGWTHECLKPDPCKEKCPDKQKNEECKKPVSTQNDCKPDSEKKNGSKKTYDPDCSDPAYINKTFSPDLFKPPKKK